jgi:hypothetical protein
MLRDQPLEKAGSIPESPPVALPRTGCQLGQILQKAAADCRPAADNAEADSLWASQ